MAWIVTFVFLKETLPSPVPITQLLKGKKVKADLDIDSDEPFLASALKSKQGSPEPEKPLPLRALLTPRVVIAAANYASLSLVDISYRAIQPLFFSTPIHLGGLGLPPSTIGNILSVFGILNGLFQVFFFARIHDHWGSKKVFTAGIASAFPVFIAFPVLNYIARTQGLSTTIWAVIGFQTVISIMLSLSYGAFVIF